MLLIPPYSRLRKDSLAPSYATGGRGPTFPGDAGDIADACRKYPAGTRIGGCSWAAGPMGPCLSFDGTSGAATIGPASFANGPGAITISLWIYPTSFAGSDKALITKMDSDSSASLWLRIQGAGAIRFTRQSDTLGLSTLASLFGANSWTHVAATWDGLNAAIYINGVQEAYSQPGWVVPSTAALLTLGRKSDSTDYLTGSISSTRMYTRALSADEVGGLYANSNRIFAGRSRGRRRYQVATASTSTVVRRVASMGYPIQHNTANQPLEFQMVSSSDHLTGLAGLAPTVEIQKQGGTFAAPAGAVTEIGLGFYQVAPNGADSNTLGPLNLAATAAGADPCYERYPIVAYDPLNSVNLGLSSLPGFAPGASGGLLTYGVDAGQVNPTLGGVTVEAYGSMQDPGYQVWSTALPGDYGNGSAGSIVGYSLTSGTLLSVSESGFTVGPSDPYFLNGFDLTGSWIVVASAATGAGQNALVESYDLATGVAALVGGAWPKGMPTGSVVAYSVLPNLPARLTSDGLNAVAGYGSMSLVQTIQTLAALLFGLRSGMPSPGSGGTATLSNSYGSITFDASGDITSISLTPPALPAISSS